MKLEYCNSKCKKRKITQKSHISSITHFNQPNMFSFSVSHHLFNKKVSVQIFLHYYTLLRVLINVRMLNNCVLHDFDCGQRRADYKPSPTLVEIFNVCLMVIYNLLWRDFGYIYLTGPSDGADKIVVRVMQPRQPV